MATLNESIKHKDLLLQRIWDYRIGYEHYLSSPLFPIIVSVLFYFACMAPWTFVDLYMKDVKWVQQYKIQPNREVTWPAVRRAIKLTMWNHLLYILPLSIAQWMWMSPIELPAEAPSLWDYIWQQWAALAVFDFQYYVEHWLFHKSRFLYKHVHAVHHEYSSPHSWVTQYLHPFELISVGIFTTTSPWFFDSHPLTQWSFMQFSIIVSVDAHIGYDIPFLPHHWLPFWGGSIKHDMHHQRPLTCYQPFFNHWDRLFGSECPGQFGGGYKPPALLDWELKERQKKLEKREAYTK